MIERLFTWSLYTLHLLIYLSLNRSKFLHFRELRLWVLLSFLEQAITKKSFDRASFTRAKPIPLFAPVIKIVFLSVITYIIVFFIRIRIQ